MINGRSAPLEVINTDGQDKQDCEINAGKRLIRRIRKNHPKLRISIVADSLYSKQPMIENIGQEHMHFVLVAKEEDWSTYREREPLVKYPVFLYTIQKDGFIAMSGWRLFP
jgi:hypothetical protein